MDKKAGDQTVPKGVLKKGEAHSHLEVETEMQEEEWPKWIG